ncbi:hypothetical protein LTR28_011762, partial [Elasticomyces elasticus]
MINTVSPTYVTQPDNASTDMELTSNVLLARTSYTFFAPGLNDATLNRPEQEKTPTTVEASKDMYVNTHGGPQAGGLDTDVGTASYHPAGEIDGASIETAGNKPDVDLLASVLCFGPLQLNVDVLVTHQMLDEVRLYVKRSAAPHPAFTLKRPRFRYQASVHDAEDIGLALIQGPFCPTLAMAIGALETEIESKVEALKMGRAEAFNSDWILKPMVVAMYDASKEQLDVVPLMQHLKRKGHRRD